MSKRPGTSPHSVISPNGPTNRSPRHGCSRSPIHAQKRRGTQTSQAAPSMEIEGRGFGYSSSPTRSCSPPPVEKPRSHRDHSLFMPRSCFLRSRSRAPPPI
ncbi:hypothetical protein GQ55_8G053100 [Panicum hallii var. hallii]|uniref:Uncharacterized protein n=1 Tax=Panicum hallii var. hallii TaxID=1504633 RepID=A0A2T7CL01_9POAL|nr:hypothetical protein GQ55_8G053100 [Panicum hallii var. hallii]